MIDQSVLAQKLAAIVGGSPIEAVGAVPVFVSDEQKRLINTEVSQIDFSSPDIQEDIKEFKKKIERHLSVVQTTVEELYDTNFPMMGYDLVLSGSSLYSIYHNLPPNDYDFYSMSSNGKALLYALLQKLHLKNEPSAEELVNDKKYSTGFDESGKIITDNAITLKSYNKKGQLQFIHRNVFQFEQENFDFVHCTPSYMLDTSKLKISPLQYYAIKNKKLMIHNPPDGEIHAYRRDKFIARGMMPFGFSYSATTTNRSQSLEATFY